MRHRFGVPALGKHTDRNDVPYLLAALTFLSDSIHRLPQNGSGVGLAQIPFVIFAHSRGDNRSRVIQRLGINMQRQLRIAQLRDRDALMIKGILDPCRRLRSVRNGNHDRRHR